MSEWSGRLTGFLNVAEKLKLPTGGRVLHPLSSPHRLAIWESGGFHQSSESKENTLEMSYRLQERGISDSQIYEGLVIERLISAVEKVTK